MLLKELTPADLENIANDIAWVVERWSRIPNVEPRAFDGGDDDLKALALVEYDHWESLFENEPTIGYRKFALVFGNILVHQLGFGWVWGIENKSRLLLRHSARTELLDPIRLAREEWKTANGRCPDFSSMYARIESALAAGRPFPITDSALISPTR